MRFVLDATTPPAPSTSTTVVSFPTNALGIPQIEPDFNGPGIGGLASFGNQLAGWAIVLGGIAVVLGVLIAVVGPRFGFHGAKALGMGGIVGGLVIGAVVAMATPGVATVYGWFA